MARSLSSGLPLSDVDVVLYAKNDKPLAHVRTDAQGLVKFPSGLLRGVGSRAAIQVMATSATKRLSLLSLQRASLDLSDRGVSGRKAPGALDAFVYTEQGVYRPGDLLNGVALLRNRTGKAVNGLPLRVRLLNPEGNPVAERSAKPDAAGGYLVTLPLSSNARTGRCSLNWHADIEAPAIGEVGFLVEAVRPPRMAASLVIDGVLQPGNSLKGSLSAA